MDRTMLVAFAFILASYGCVANDDLTTTFDERREESTSTDGIGQAPTTTTFDERREEVTSTDGTDQATCADTSEEATGTNGGGCEWWTDYAQYCAYDYLYDDSDFTAGDMCCACGGGEVGDSTAPTPTSPTPAPTSSPNPATCADTSEEAIGTNGGGCEWRFARTPQRKQWGSTAEAANGGRIILCFVSIRLSMTTPTSQPQRCAAHVGAAKQRLAALFFTVVIRFPRSSCRLAASST
ncbi:unnamed protein product, partial [Prorocentrum cordatum]